MRHTKRAIKTYKTAVGIFLQQFVCFMGRGMAYDVVVRQEKVLFFCGVAWYTENNKGWW